MQAVVRPASCGSEEDYAAFLRPRLRAGIRLVAIAGEHKGDCGPFLEIDSSGPSMPCKVHWEAQGRADWVNWRDIAFEVRA